MQQTFTAVIEQHADINGAFVAIPFDVQAVFGAKRVKVQATFDGVPYRGSIVSMGGIYLLGMTQAIRKQIGKGFGDEVRVVVAVDDQPRSVEVPPELTAGLEENPKAKAFFEGLSFSNQRKYVQWIEEAKKEETRTARVRQALEMLDAGKTR